MAAITSAVIAVGTAGYQIYNAEKQKSDAKKAIKEFDRQELDNPYRNVQISTLKSATLFSSERVPPASCYSTRE